MVSKIFVNLPVKDLKKSIAFFTKLGFTFNPQFTDETSTCMIVSVHIFVMLITEEKFKTFTNKQIADSLKTKEVLLALSVDSNAVVDDVFTKAIQAGAKEAMPPMDLGWMYLKTFNDLDNHHWEIFFMDENAMPKE